MNTTRGSSFTPDPASLNIVSVVIFLAVALGGLALTMTQQSPAWVVGGVIIGWIAALSPRVAKQWERGVMLRLGRYTGLRGPGLFWIIPFVDSITRMLAEADAAGLTLDDVLGALAAHKKGELR